MSNVLNKYFSDVILILLFFNFPRHCYHCFFIPICLYTQSRHTVFSWKKVTVYIYIFIYIFTHFWGVTTPSPPKKHIINKSHGFAHFSRKLLALPMVRPWPSNPCRAGVGTWQTAKTHQSQLLKASLVHRSTRCSFFLMVYLPTLWWKNWLLSRGNASKKYHPRVSNFSHQVWSLRGSNFRPLEDSGRYSLHGACGI